MVLYDMGYPVRGVRNLLGIGDLCIISIVDFERCFEVAVIVGSINGGEVELDN